LAAGVAPRAFAQSELKIEPDSVTTCAGNSAAFLAKKDGKSVTASWSIDPVQGTLTTDKDSAKFTAPAGVSATTVLTGTVTLTATSTDGKEKATAQIALAGFCRSTYGGEVVRATLGFEQIGAAGTPNDQKYSFDFFISRPLPIGGRDAHHDETDAEFYFGPRFRWWGDVRIGSYPQQVNSDLATFSSNFTTNAGKLAVNKLVQSAEFITGPEVRIAAFPTARDSVTEPVRSRYALMAYFGLGSIGPFPPGDDPSVFAVPAAPAAGAAASAQFAAFHAQYPNIASKYVAFVPPDHTQFSKQWSAGLRLYTYYADTSATSQPLAKAPASVEIGFGKNYFVAPGGENTWRASAYYPFALGDRTKADTLIIYFFGDVNMRLSPESVTTQTTTKLFLAPAVDSSSAAIPITNADVSLVPAPLSHRDTYRVGVSIDLIRVWNKLSAPAAAK
jgi:hypothetical protein